MHEQELFLARIVPQRGLVLAGVEEVQNGAVRTAGQHHAVDREPHIASQAERVGRFEVRDVRRKRDLAGILHAVEVGVEENGQLAEHADDVPAVRSDDVDAIAMHVVRYQIAGDAKHFRNTTVLHLTIRTNSTSMHRLYPLVDTLLIISRSWI